ncbi:DUF4892 domain-containing protein [Aliamphritea hakodatensis]|uniref:DUF4892 domain-containing protein n=1 Tax=Aliamphritea hakodatensis TaxID=2895352 RepID=UPI0022FD7C64|nr:DUF4892 domain-containing protein [Aliamphritea hakodatensis]
MYRIKRVLSGLMMLVAGSAFAESDLRGSSDYEGLKRYPLSWIVEYQSEASPDYLLALGKMKKKSGVIAPEASRRLSGQLRQITYRIPDGHSAEETFDFIVGQLQQQNAEELFRCQSRQCGNSHQWANQVFGVSRLYGVDRTQSYLAARLGGDFIAVYTVKRGNKRVYLQLDILSDKPEAAVETLAVSGEVGSAVSDWQADFETSGAWLPVDFVATASDDQIDASVRQILNKIQSDTRTLVVLGYSDLAEGALSRSSEYVARVERVLLENGVSPERLSIIASGNLSVVKAPEQQGAVWLQLME